MSPKSPPSLLLTPELSKSICSHATEIADMGLGLVTQGNEALGPQSLDSSICTKAGVLLFLSVGT